MLQKEPDPRKFLEAVRANVAFEQMIVAALVSAAICGAGWLMLNLFTSATAGRLGFAALLSSIVGGFGYAFTVFLIGFGASATVVAPLFLMLERMKLRRIWPYFIAVLVVGFVATWLIAGRPPAFDRLSSWAFLLPCAIYAWCFRKLMRPLWRQAMKAEAEQETRIVRFH